MKKSLKHIRINTARFVRCKNTKKERKFVLLINCKNIFKNSIFIYIFSFYFVIYDINTKNNFIIGIVCVIFIYLYIYKNHIILHLVICFYIYYIMLLVSKYFLKLFKN